MKVFKFGGASVKNAEAVKNVASILSLYKDEKLGVVISAMGKTTNAMEQIIAAYWNQNEAKFNQLIEERRAFHHEILDGLFADSTLLIYEEVDAVLNTLIARFERDLSDNFDFEYDQVVGLGEVISTKIVTAYLNANGFSARWKDARKLIRTNRKFREAELDWKRTEVNFQSKFMPDFEEADILVTQGFVGSNDNSTTTLGREGSDFTAGIIAY